MTRRGQDFIEFEMLAYLGINWAEGYTNAINNCISTYSGLQNMTRTGNQTSISVFDTMLTEGESTLLFKETASFGKERGLGVWRKPTAGGTHRENGGQFVFINGRPYRYNSEQLSSNIEYILENFFSESKETAIGQADNIPVSYKLEQNYPNPFNPKTMIKYQLPMTNEVELSVFNLLGQKVAILITEKQQAGYHQVEWDASGFASGIYYYQLVAGEYREVKKMILLR